MRVFLPSYAFYYFSSHCIQLRRYELYPWLRKSSGVLLVAIRCYRYLYRYRQRQCQRQHHRHRYRHSHCCHLDTQQKWLERLVAFGSFWLDQHLSNDDKDNIKNEKINNEKNVIACPRGTSPGARTPIGTPIYVATPSDAYLQIFQDTIPTRPQDLVFVGNASMPIDWRILGLYHPGSAFCCSLQESMEQQ